MRLIEQTSPTVSPARVGPATTEPLRIAVIQHEWSSDAAALASWLDAAIDLAAASGAHIVFLPELTLSRYPADVLPSGFPAQTAEHLANGPTLAFASRAARRAGVHVHASVYRRAGAADGLGLNTAIVVDLLGNLVAATDKRHLPVTAGYYEDHYFRPGSADDPYPV